jgi:hypothetical protein
LDSFAPDLDFVGSGLDFVVKDLDFLSGNLEIVHRVGRPYPWSAQGPSIVVLYDSVPPRLRIHAASIAIGFGGAVSAGSAEAPVCRGGRPRRRIRRAVQAPSRRIAEDELAGEIGARGIGLNRQSDIDGEIAGCRQRVEVERLVGEERRRGGAAGEPLRRKQRRRTIGDRKRHAGHASRRRGAAREGLSIDPTFTVRRYRADAPSDNPVFLAGRQRIYEMMRKIGLPEDKPSRRGKKRAAHPLRIGGPADPSFDTMPYIWMGMAGVAKNHLGSWEQAVAWFRQAMEANRKYPDGYFQLRSEERRVGKEC